MGLQNRDELHLKSINQALEAISQLQKKTDGDPYQLKYHFMSQAGWINDPNGLIYYRGEYHLFYQLHPYSADNGLKHWGHAKSKDLVHWQHLPVALAPSEDFEQHGCFSGTAVDDNGVLTLIYTGNVFLNKVKAQVQCVAFSEDGITFKKYPGNPVVRHVPSEGSSDFRDPKVWKHAGGWYMAIGSGKNGKGNALLYKSKDLLSWDYIGKMAESQSPDQGIVWNCPDFFSIGNKDVLLVSPAVWPENLKDVRKSIYYIGRMNYSTGVFTADTVEDIDFGYDFYAPQTWIDDKGRVILLGWMDMWFNAMPTKEFGRAGAMTIPREVIMLPNGKLGFRPIEELKQLRGDHLYLETFTLPPHSEKLSEWGGDSLEMIAQFDLSSCNSKRFGIKLRQSRSRNQETVIAYDVEQQEVIIDRTKSGATPGEISRCNINAKKNGILKFHIFLDISSLEVFINDGQHVITHRIYPDPTSLNMEVFTEEGAIKVKSIDMWTLRSIHNQN